MDLSTLEYPRAVHKPTVRDTPWVLKHVYNATECAAALADGWSLIPILIDSPITPPDATPPPVSEVMKPRRGRPPKAK